MCDCESRLASSAELLICTIAAPKTGVVAAAEPLEDSSF
jgi:hypothetical protein